MLSAGLNRAASRAKRVAAAALMTLALGVTLVVAGPVAQAAEAIPLPSGDGESLAPCTVQAEINAQFSFDYQGEVKKVQCFYSPKGVELPYVELLEPPAGYVISPAWDGEIFVNSSVIGMYEHTVPIVRETHQVDISYVFEGAELYRQSFPDQELGAVIAASDLDIRKGYRLAEPFASHEVTGSEVLTVNLVREVYDVTVTYTAEGEPVGTQPFLAREHGSVITEADLVIPEGYELAGAFADYEVTGEASIEVPVVKIEAIPEDEEEEETPPGEGPEEEIVLPEDEVTPDEEITVEEADGGAEETPAKSSDSGQPAQLAQTGSAASLPFTAAGGVLVALGCGALAATRLRARRATLQ